MTAPRRRTRVTKLRLKRVDFCAEGANRHSHVLIVKSAREIEMAAEEAAERRHREAQAETRQISAQLAKLAAASSVQRPTWTADVAKATHDQGFDYGELAKARKQFPAVLDACVRDYERGELSMLERQEVARAGDSLHAGVLLAERRYPGAYRAYTTAVTHGVEAEP